MKLLIQGHPQSAEVPHVADFKSACISFIIVPRALVLEVCNVKPTSRKIMGWESFDVVRFDLGPLLQGQMRTAKLKSAYNLIIIDPRFLQCEANL